VFCFAEVSIFASATTVATTNMPLEKSSYSNAGFYALVVGVEKFENMNLTEYAHLIDESAVAMYEKLNNSANWKQENIKLLLNENATKENIHNAIVNWLDDKESRDDVVLFYFSGHGWSVPILNRLKGHAYIVTYNNSDWHYSENQITDKELDSWLDELESKHTIVILDSCHSGKMVDLRQRGRVVLTAGGKYFFCGVDEDETLGCGIFTYFLLQGLSGIADLNNDGWVSAEEVFHYAKKPTIHFSIWKQFPFITKYNGRLIFWFFQVPHMYDKHFGDIPLVQLP
jgi:hypothetical protein